jgi:hypothetical protein
MNVRQRDRDAGEYQQGGADHQVPANVLANTVRVFFVFLRVLGNIRRIIHGRNVILSAAKLQRSPETFRGEATLSISDHFWHRSHPKN